MGPVRTGGSVCCRDARGAQVGRLLRRVERVLIPSRCPHARRRANPCRSDARGCVGLRAQAAATHPTCPRHRARSSRPRQVARVRGRIRCSPATSQLLVTGHRCRVSSDCVIFGDVIEHLYDPESILRSARHLLSPDGVILVRADRSRGSFFKRRKALLRADPMHQPCPGDSMPCRFRPFSHATFIKMLLDVSGFCLIPLIPSTLAAPIT